jgi:3-oxoacyl-[acyl-carrier-protein] synthase-3
MHRRESLIPVLHVVKLLIMGDIHAAITGIGAFLPEYRLTNDEISTMVDTSDEWIMQRIGIKERRIFKEPGKATSDMGSAAVLQLLEKTKTSHDDIDLLICATITPDRPVPATANTICNKARLHNAWSFDLNAACSGFIFSLATGASFIESGRYKKVVIVAADMMSSITDYTDRSSCPLFGDGAAAVLLEPATGDEGIQDYINHTDGKGRNYLYVKSGGSKHPASAETVANREHFIHQDGPTVFKHAVKRMADVALNMMQKHQITAENLAWLVPHQANMRIIEAVARRMELDQSRVMINIQKYGNTTAATVPLCLYDYEKQLKKGDNLILAAFGAGFTWGALYLKWAYDSE